jgi:tRNA (cmo5U34)-methyltransferase
VGRYRFTPDRYEQTMGEIPRFAELQDAVAGATRGIAVRAALELGTGTGETARRVLALHPEARLTGVDESGAMVDEARRALPAADLRVGRIEDELPPGPFDLVFSALAVHHLGGDGKRDLFRRVRGVLRPGGRFVLGDVVVPERPEDAAIPLTEGFDLPDSAADQLEWLEDAGFTSELVWSHADLAVLRADAPGD